MGHYKDQYEADAEAEALKKIQTKSHLFYTNKINGINMVTKMIQSELEVPLINVKKIEHMLAQIHCLSEKD